MASKQINGGGAQLPLRYCDTHVHVFDPSRFPYVASRRFTPGKAGVQTLARTQMEVGVTHTVLVQPSVYGHDHTCLLDALHQFGGRARGVAVLGQQMKPAAIDQMMALGVCANRLNLAVEGPSSLDTATGLFEEALSLTPADWHMQIHARLDTILGMAPRLLTSGRRIVLDHFGLPDLHAPDLSVAWPALLDLLGTGLVFLKLSAPYLISTTHSPYRDLDELRDSLAQHVPGQLLWGSNWPHTQGTARSPLGYTNAVEPFRAQNDVEVRNHLKTRFSPEVAQQVFQDTPEKLYGFNP